MRRTPHFLMTDPDEVRRLIREHPWATIVSTTADGLVASHYPFLLEEPAPDDDPAAITLVSHVGRPDERLHGLGGAEVMIIVQGPHGYVSPGWYDTGDVIPTWNHVTAHLWGTPELLGDEENLRVLGEIVDHFEARMPEPASLGLETGHDRADAGYVHRQARGTVGIRVRVTRFDARAKLSQNKPPEVRERIVTALRSDGPYAHPALADEMDRVGFTGDAD